MYSIRFNFFASIGFCQVLSGLKYQNSPELNCAYSDLKIEFARKAAAFNPLPQNGVGTVGA